MARRSEAGSAGAARACDGVGRRGRGGALRRPANSVRRADAADRAAEGGRQADRSSRGVRRTARRHDRDRLDVRRAVADRIARALRGEHRGAHRHRARLRESAARRRPGRSDRDGVRASDVDSAAGRRPHRLAVGADGGAEGRLRRPDPRRAAARPVEGGAGAGAPGARTIREAAMHVYIEDIGKYEGQDVELKGWLHNRRSSGKIHFLIVRDGTGFIQAVMSKAAVGDEQFTLADHLSQETSIIVRGTVRADTRAPSGYEIDVKSFEIVGTSTDYPITPKEHGVDYLLDRRHLWIRSERQQAILRVRHEVINAVRDFFNTRGFILADTPIFTPAACEGTTTLFPTQYFDETTAYLTQSGQLYNEANAMALGRVYCFGPTFRAEKSKTRRHLTEFWMVEPEMAYADLNDVMALAEDLVVSVVARVLEARQRELKVLERDTSKLESVQKPFPRI